MKQLPNRDAPHILTVIIRDPSPLVHFNDAPSYRSVRIELTRAQRDQIAVRHVAGQSGNEIFEEVSRCFLEPLEEGK